MLSAQRYPSTLIEIEAYTDLRCPGCSGGLRLEPFATEHQSGREYVGSGVLLCEGCGVLYPIEADTPVLLRFRTPFHDWFAAAHTSDLRRFSDYSVPRNDPRTGEMQIQETFTEEWDLTREDALSYSFTQAQLEDFHRECTLRELARLPDESKPRSVLDVGCGAGMETIVLRNVTGADRVIGLDLNFALLSLRPGLRRQPGVDFVIASLFDLPFAPASFDLVFSMGVLHHTYSTVEAFRSISTRVKRDGYLFIWVYALEDHLTPPPGGWWGTRHPLTERTFRPLISRSPRPVRNFTIKLLTLLAHLLRVGSKSSIGRTQHSDRWTRANTEHAIRDWLSPRYAWRHGFNEVTEWFEGEGYRIVGVQSSLASQRRFDRPLFGIGMTGQNAEASGRSD